MNEIFQKKINRFVFEFMEKIEDSIFSAQFLSINQEDKYQEILKKIDKLRDEIPSLLKISGLKDNINDIPKKELKTSLLNSYHETSLPEDLDGFIDTIFYRNVDLSQDLIENYRKNFEEFKLKEDLNTLYDLTFANRSIVKNFEFDNDKDLGLKEVLDNAFKDLAVKDRAEALSNLNIFFEEYLKTDIGKKHVELINKDFLEKLEDSTNKEDKKSALNNWMNSIISCANKHSPKSILIEYDSYTQKTNFRTEGGGKFDGCFIINQTTLTKEEKKRLIEVENIKELASFEDSLSHKLHIQISTTSDRGINIEGDSVVRHSLANLILSSMLNVYYKEIDLSRKNAWLSSFNGDKDFKDQTNSGNKDIRGAINEAFSSVFGNDYFSKTELSDSVKKFDKIQSVLTKNPEKFVMDILNIEVNKKITITEDNIKDLMKLSGENPVFRPKSYLSLYQNHKVKANLKGDSFEKNLNNSEVAGLLQYSALLKAKHFESNGANITLEALNQIAENLFTLRVISPKEKINNMSLNEISIESIDKFVFGDFISNNNSSDLLSQLDLNSKRNISHIVSNVVNEKSYPSKLNLNLTQTFNDLKYLSNEKNVIYGEKIISSINHLEDRLEREKAELRADISELRADILEDEELTEKQLILKSFLDSKGFDTAKKMKSITDTDISDFLETGFSGVLNKSLVVEKLDSFGNNESTQEDHLSFVNNKIIELFKKEIIIERDDEQLLEAIKKEGVTSIEQFNELDDKEKLELYNSSFEIEEDFEQSLKKEVRRSNNSRSRSPNRR
tara:strand:+ start:36686 stop:39046 length:2361 start_codon:yes stop_codon:yes gene_type:complete